MNISVYCNGKMIDKLDFENGLPELNFLLQYSIYNPISEVLSFRIYRLVGVSSNRIDVLSLV